ncbi:MAG: hypothetical protein HKN90_01560 [Flavobacteriaceae bacterium]|nr:hypothetical protein [Flavobacteriaceae bacterium]
MKNTIFGITLLATVLSISAQDAKDTTIDKQVMRQALLYGDNNIAATSIYNIIAKEGVNSSYKDSLAYLYFNGRRFSSCFMVCKDILSRDSGKQDILEMQAVSLENLGVLDKAAQSYAKLVVKSNNNYHAYKLANIYFALKKYKEAMNAIEKAESLNDTGTIKITTPINKNLNQQVSLKSAMANLKGLIQFATDDLEGAKASFQQAVTLEPDFKLAKENLETAKEGKKKEDN